MTTEMEEKILDFMERLYIKTETDKKELMEAIQGSRYEAKSDLAEFKQEMAEFKQEMTEFKQEMTEFKQEMTEFKQEMTEFKQEMTEFKQEMTTQLKEINGKVDQLIVHQKQSDQRLLWLERRTINS